MICGSFLFYPYSYCKQYSIYLRVILFSYGFHDSIIFSLFSKNLLTHFIQQIQSLNLFHCFHLLPSSWHKRAKLCLYSYWVVIALVYAGLVE